MCVEVFLIFRIAYSAVRFVYFSVKHIRAINLRLKNFFFFSDELCFHERFTSLLANLNSQGEADHRFKSRLKKNCLQAHISNA